MAVAGPSSISVNDSLPKPFPPLGLLLTTAATIDMHLRKSESSNSDLGLSHSLLHHLYNEPESKVLKMEPRNRCRRSDRPILKETPPLLLALHSPLTVDRNSHETSEKLQNAFNTVTMNSKTSRTLLPSAGVQEVPRRHCQLMQSSLGHKSNRDNARRVTSSKKRSSRVLKCNDFPLLTIPSISLAPVEGACPSKKLHCSHVEPASCSKCPGSVTGRVSSRLSPDTTPGPLLGVNAIDIESTLGLSKGGTNEGKDITRLRASPGELEGLAVKGWPLLFHNIHSDNIQLSLDRRRAKRFESFCKGICFSNRPIALNERVYLKFSEVSTSWSGVVRFGLMSHDPATINGSELPRYACPDLTNKPGYWAKAVPERFAEQSNTLFFYFNRNGDVMFGLNNEDKGLFFSGVNTSGPLWALVDIYGNSTSMEFIDGRQMNNLSPSSGVPPTDVSVSPELMQAYASMRLQQPSPGLSPGGHSQSMPSLPAAPGFSTTGPPIRFYNTFSFNPMPFHSKSGRNVCFSSDKMIAVRLVEEYCNGYVFTQRPLRLGERMVIQILSVDTAFVGGLAFGMTACDPKHLNTEELPDDSDLLLDRPEYWVVNKDVCSAPEVGDELSFHLTEDGEVRYGKNGHHIGTLMHVDKTLPLWVFFDVYGSTQKIKSLGIVSGILPVSAQHRASIGSGGGLTVALPPPRQSNSPSSSSSSHVPTSGSSTVTPPPRPPPPRNSPSTRQAPSLRSESPTPPSLPPKPFRPLPAPPPAPGTILQPTQALSAVPPASQLSPPPVTPRTHSHHSGPTLATPPCAQHSANNLARMADTMREHESQEAADNASNECSVCFEKAVDCVLYTCGHMCLCYECAIDIKDNQGALCPICRQAIKDIIKIYRS